MNMDDVCFVSVAFGQEYCKQQLRLKQSIKDIYPDANLNFYYDRLPSSSRMFQESLYGFKVYALKETIELGGFKKLIWLDPAMILCDKINELFHFQVVAIKDDHRLTNLISNQALNHFGLTREQIDENDWRLVGGSLYYFDLTTERASAVFGMWYDSEIKGLFGSQHEAASEQIQGHRNDESCMAAAMYLNGAEPISGYKVGYCVEKNPIFIKKHFK